MRTEFQLRTPQGLMELQALATQAVVETVQRSLILFAIGIPFLMLVFSNPFSALFG